MLHVQNHTVINCPITLLKKHEDGTLKVCIFLHQVFEVTIL